MAAGALATAVALVPRPASVGQAAAGTPPPLPSAKYVNGHWFDGTRFVSRTAYSMGSILTAADPGPSANVIDLDGGFVVPPFAEAHNHNLNREVGFDEQLARYLRDGVFYSKNQNNVRIETDRIRHRVNLPASVDVAYANGGLVAPGGHAVELYERFLAQGEFPGWSSEDLEGRAFFSIGGEQELDAKWPLVRQGKPDFIKAYLEYSEEYERRRQDPRFRGQRGLSPALLAEIVRRARAAGLRVSAHIETGADFRAAVAAGVDEIAHLPGYRIPADADPDRFAIRAPDARAAAERGVVVVTTTFLGTNFYRNDPPGLRRIIDSYTRNLRTLRAAKVKIALGSDHYPSTSLVEAMNVRRLGVLDPVELLLAWTVTSARTIFPGRKIGSLDPGHEASFLVLDGDPLVDFENVKRIRMRVKQGHRLAEPLQ